MRKTKKGQWQGNVEQDLQICCFEIRLNQQKKGKYHIKTVKAGALVVLWFSP